MSDYTAPTSEAIKANLQATQRIAVVGLSPKPHRASHWVSKAMQGFGYTIVPVRPKVDSILDEPAYPDLHAVPEPVDLVNVFRAPQYVEPVVDACIELGIPRLWLQLGVVNPTAAQRAAQAGIFVVMDRCIYQDYLRLQ